MNIDINFHVTMGMLNMVKPKIEGPAKEGLEKELGKNLKSCVVIGNNDLNPYTVNIQAVVDITGLIEAKAPFAGAIPMMWKHASTWPYENSGHFVYKNAIKGMEDQIKDKLASTAFSDLAITFKSINGTYEHRVENQ